MPLYYMGQEQGWIEYEGAVPKTGWMWINNRWNKVFRWGGDLTPILEKREISANGASKVTHTGWARPNLTWTMTTGTGQFNSNGTLILPHGRGQIVSVMNVNDPHQYRIVSNLKGVLSQTITAERSWRLWSAQNLTFEEGEQVYLEVNGYSSHINDRFFLSAGPDEWW